MKRKHIEKLKMSRAFTLIELLAVILILGVTALIAIPVVTNVIEESRLKSTKLSAKGYVDAVNNELALSLMKGDIEDGIYSVEQIQAFGIEVKGNVPLAGNVIIEDGVVVAYELQYDEYTVLYQDDLVEAGKTEEVAKWHKALNNDNNNNYNIPEAKKIALLKQYVYFNPQTGTKCTADNYANRFADRATAYKETNTATFLAAPRETTGTKPVIPGKNLGEPDADIQENSAVTKSADGYSDGCLKWLKFTVTNDSYELMLSNSVVDTLSYDNANASMYVENAYAIADEKTSSWSNTLFNDEYNKKYRFITAEEVANIYGMGNFDSTLNNPISYYVKSGNLMAQSNIWNQSDDIGEVCINRYNYKAECYVVTKLGFVTSTIESNKIWTVLSSGALYPITLDGEELSNTIRVYLNNIGIRPIIKVSKSLID